MHCIAICFISTMTGRQTSLCTGFKLFKCRSLMDKHQMSVFSCISPDNALDMLELVRAGDDTISACKPSQECHVIWLQNFLRKIPPKCS